MKLTEKQQVARLEILREVDRLGGEVRWSQLHRCGFHYMQVSAAALRGDLSTVSAYRYRITEAGKAALEGGTP